MSRRAAALALLLTVMFSIVALARSAEAGGAAGDAAERFRWFGEEFYFSVEMLGSEAARCAVSVGFPTDHPDYGRVVPLEGLAMSVGFFANVYPMRDTAETYLRMDDGLPAFSSKVIDERGRRRQYDVSYLGARFRAEIVRTDDSSSRRTSRHGPSDLHDAMTWMLDLRSRDLAVGRSYVYHIFDGWKMSRLTARIIAHTEVYSGLGTIPVAELEFTREVVSSYAPLPYIGSGTVLPPVYTVTEGPTRLGVGWFSLDDRRIPVGVDIATPIGSLRMIIDRHVPPS